MTGLRIAPNLQLPLDMVTEPIGILANRGRGKSYSTHVLVEEIHNADVPVVVLDVKGDWWGLRSSADGKSDGLPFYIFGGDHADLPLEPTAGELLADLVVDERVSVVLDLSHMSKTKARSFTVAFAERLYHRNRDPLFVVVDEADVLIPQRATAETARLLGAMEDIAKRGRGRGIGMAVVTQRPQEVAKSVLDLMDTLILLGMTGPRSLKSISEWISTHVDEDTTAAEVMATLPSLPVGNAWVWSPMQGLLQRVGVRRIRTFDSHVTPKPGQKRTTPGARAALDLDALGERITATVERAKADDPKALRKRITELERELDTERVKPGPQTTVERVEIPAITGEMFNDFTGTASQLHDTLASIQQRLQAIMTTTEPPMEGKQGQPTTRSSAPRANQASGTTGRAPVARPSTTQKPSPRHQRETRPATDLGEAPRLGRTERSILSVLAQHGPRTHDQVALLTGYSRKASTIGVALGKLRKLDFVEPGQPITATQAGIDWLGDDYEQLPEGQALIDYWRSKFGLTEQRVLDAVLDAYPHDTSQAEIAEVTGYSPTASTIGVALGRLRKVGVIDRWRISDDFAASAGLAGAS
ncbi:ATP-binding protein [Nocardioides sp. LHG3406-4]|uniref:ATP-binding protein n=1 Tax=Nocardioides sp. LHG3406-4 TaxID=2804575 RepID=UPI003CE75BA8